MKQIFFRALNMSPYTNIYFVYFMARIEHFDVDRGTHANANNDYFSRHTFKFNMNRDDDCDIFTDDNLSVSGDVGDITNNVNNGNIDSLPPTPLSS